MKASCMKLCLQCCAAFPTEFNRLLVSNFSNSYSLPEKKKKKKKRIKKKKVCSSIFFWDQSLSYVVVFSFQMVIKKKDCDKGTILGGQDVSGLNFWKLPTYWMNRERSEHLSSNWVLIKVTIANNFHAVSFDLLHLPGSFHVLRFWSLVVIHCKNIKCQWN